jgi:hypothetical protein
MACKCRAAAIRRKSDDGDGELSLAMESSGLSEQTYERQKHILAYQVEKNEGA